MATNTTSFLNTPQAVDDLFVSSTTGLTEDSLFITYLAVMANDLGGAAKTLYSIDNGTNSIGVFSPTDLLTQDIVRTEALTTDLSAHGAKIWITTDGKVGYDAATLSADFKDQLQHLSSGQFLTDTFTYAIRLGNGTLSWATATVQIAGVNDAPVVTGAVTGSATEDASSVTLNALANASDVDVGATLSVTNLPSSLPPGVTYNALTHSFTLDPSNAAFQYLAAGGHTTVTVNYGVTDGTATTAASVSWNVVGTNDVPVIGGVSTGAVIEENSTPNLSTGGALSIADIDQGQSTFAPQASASGTYGTFTLAANGNWTYTASDTQTAIQQLGAGQSITDSFTAVSSDGTASQVVTVTINGTNDVPVIGGVSTGAVAEDDSTPNLSTGGALTIADVDQGQSTFAPQASAAGTYGTFTLDAAGNWTYTASDTQTAIQQLGAGQSISDSFTAVSSDGTASQLVTVTINGTNDVPVIGGVSTGTVQEDVGVVTGNLATSGSLTIADVDQGQSNFAPQASASGTYGTFTLAANGAWTYTASDTQAAIQQLGAGQSISDSFTAVSSDGTASQVVTVTINGTNDVPLIGGVSTGAVTEENSTPNLSTGGALTIADIDQGQSTFAPQASASGTYGTFTLAANGSWTYTASNSQTAIQQLGAGESISDSFTAVSSDGTASQVVTVTINGTNDVPVIGGVFTGAVAEDDSTPSLTTGGALTIADVDQGQSTFAPQASAAGTYGTFTLAANGAWTYTASDTQTAIQQLGAGQSITDTFTAVSSDGTASQLVTVTINGTNDVPVIGGVSSGSVQEDIGVVTGNLATSGSLTIADVDQGQSNFAPQASASGTYGTFTLAANGAWTYTASDAQAAIQQLGVGQSITDSFTAMSSDGTASQVVTVTINGTNDVPVIGGVSTGVVAEDDSTPSLTTGGALTIADVDQGQSTFAPQASAAGTYGTFTLAANGNWTYAASNSQAAIQQLAAGQSITDSFTAVSSDGTASQLVAVTINGTNDVPVIGGVSTGAVAEDDSTPNLSTGGALTIADVDAGQSTFAPQASAAGTYGTFTLAANGNWTYTASDTQTAIQQLGAGQSITDSFTAVSSDGTASQLVTVTINGTNDVPVIGGVSTGAVTEDDSTPSLSTGGALIIADNDQGQSAFAPQASAAGTYGTFTLDAAGNWTYTASDTQAAIQQLGAGQSITDSFTAVSSDGTASQVLTVTINGTNDVPVIGGVSSGSVQEDIGVVTGNLATSGSLTIADVDQGQSNFAPQASASGTYGTFTLAANGAWTYTASDAQAAIQQLGVGQSITDSFTAMSSDGTASQVVTVTINGTNDVPVLTGSQATLAAGTEDVPYTVSAANLLAGFTDVDGDTLSVSGLASNHGMVVNNGNGTYTITPGANYNGAVSLTYNVVDGHGGSVAASESFNLAAVNDAPALTGTQATLAAGTEDVPYVVSAANLLAGFTDVDGDTLSVSGLSANHGTVVNNGNGTFTVTPTADYNGSVGLSYNVVDGHGSSVAASESFNLAAVNDAPTTTPVTLTAIAEDSGARLITQAQLLSNASDADGNSLTATGLIIASGTGSLVSNGNGTWSYTPALNDDTAVSFNYTVTDGTLGAAGSATLDITPVNDAPTDIDFSAATPPSGTTLPGAGSMIATLTTDDVDNSTGFTYSFSSGTGTGFALGASTGVLTTNAGLAASSTYTLKFVSTDAGGLQTPEQTLTIITGTSGNSGDANLSGATGDDILYALSNGNNQNQHDVVFAGGGDDTVFGQDGADDLHGGIGNDTLYGGAGNDTFFFDTALNAATNVDTIKDFSTGNDHISLVKSGLFSSLTGSAGNTTLGTDFSANQTTAGTGSEHVFYDPATGNLYYDANAGAHGDAVLFANLTNTDATHPTIATTDFIIR